MFNPIGIIGPEVTGRSRWANAEALYQRSTGDRAKVVEAKIDIRQALTLGVGKLV